ncbi:tail fiber assembly protein, partial [Escherichia coli]|uniref:tail fiber assembly protein n=3 Tax=Escherichia coli TaxID=562 RepID=UPI000750D5E6
GKNWYEEVKNFQPDTIKIVYDENNIIVAITRDASTLNPEGFSVVEVPDITANRRTDDSGKWMFKDGVVVKRTYTEEEQRQQAENEKQSLLQLVRDKTQLWDSQLRLGIISDENKQKLTEWMLYAQKVESTDTSSLPVTFPEQPE